MRVLPHTLATILMLSAAACATGPSESRYSADMDRLMADCRERGGILVTTGANTGRPEVDNACQIRGGSSDRIPN